MWILTRTINEYNQDGEYFVSAFTNKPTFQELKNILFFESDDTICRLIAMGGGRKDIEPEWYYLFEFKEGTSYKF